MDPNIIKSQMQNADLARAIAMVPDQYRAAIANAAIASQVVFKRDPYYSKGRLQLTVSKAMTTTTLTIAKGFQCVLFGYGLNDSMTSAGFPASIGYDQATLADTNLFKGGETNAAELELITGLGFQLTPDSDAQFARLILHQCYMSGGVNGNTNDFKWGSPLFWPGGAGLFGSGYSPSVASNFNDNMAVTPVLTNGLPGSEDWSKDIDPILWGPKGQADSTFQVVLTVQRALTYTAVDRSAGAMGAAPLAYTGPTAPNAAPLSGAGTYVDFFVRLYGAQFAPRGRNR